MSLVQKYLYCSISKDGRIYQKTKGILTGSAISPILSNIYLNDFDKCLKDYFTLTGKPALIPRYALGNWWCKNEKYNEEHIKKLVGAFEHNEIPLSILLLDKDWHKRKDLGNNKFSKTGFSFDRSLFKDPVELINFLHSKGIRLGLNINPGEGIYNIDDFYDRQDDGFGGQ